MHPVLKFVEMGEMLALPQRLMPMWDVKVALVIMPVMEPQVALGIMATQGARIVQAVSGRRLVSILVTTQHRLISISRSVAAAERLSSRDMFKLLEQISLPIGE